MTNPARVAVERPRVVALAALGLLLFGALSWKALPRQENPTLEDRFAQVVTYLPGADPERVEHLVTERIEDAVAEVDDVRHIFSRSGFGRSWLQVEVEKSAPVARRLDEIRSQVQEARTRLPESASDPEIDTRILRTHTLVLALVGAEASPVLLREQAEALRRDLEQRPAVRAVSVVGLPEEEIRVAVDARRLAQRGLALERVAEALSARNVRLPSGELELGPTRSGLHTSGAFDAVGEVERTYLGAGPEGLPIRLADVARVTRGLAEPEALVRAGGARAVALGVEMRPGRNAVAFGERIRAFLEERAGALPAGLHVRVVADEPTYVGERLDLLTGSLQLGLVLVVALTFLGLGWRSGAVVSVTIPLALAVAVGLQGLLELPLHQISIAALVIATGIVVDESIVVAESIHRHLERGLAPREAAVEGLGEIHLAVLAGAATTVAAFLPLLVMEGDVGDFVRSIPLVVSAMLLASVGVAHFVTPLLAVAAHRLAPGLRSGGLWERIRPDGPYRRALAHVARHPARVIAGFAAAFVAALALLALHLWPPSFFPDADRHQFLIEVELPEGAPLRETTAVVAAVERRLEAEPELRDWTAFVGEDAPKFYYNEFKGARDESRAQLVVNTHERVPFRATRAVAERVGAKLAAAVPGAEIRARVLRQGYAGGSAVEIYVTGDRLDVLRALAERVRRTVAALPGTAEVRDSFHFDPVSLRAHVDEARANRLGISHRDIARSLRLALDGGVATTFREADEEIDVRVRLAERDRADAEALSTLPLRSAATERAVPLAHVARIEPGFVQRAILRYDRKREAVVEAELAPGAKLYAVARAVERAVREGVPVPPGYALAFAGRQEAATESFLSLARAAVAAVFLIYIILVVRFRSLAQPGLILLALPMAVAGASAGLAATGNPLGFMAFLGTIALAGIAVNDSIVFVDSVNRRRAGGRPLEEAVAEGAATRLRPVLITSATTIGGLLPLSIGGGAFWAPFGFAMIFGLAASTLLTLLVQPAAYLLLERGRLRRRAPAAR